MEFDDGGGGDGIGWQACVAQGLSLEVQVPRLGIVT